MAKSTKKLEPVAQDPSGSAPQSAPTDAPQNPAARRPSPVEADYSKAMTAYANFSRVNFTAEELILDFGLDTHPGSAKTRPVSVTQRVVINFYTGKRLLQALHAAIRHHETTFGVLETDVQKRVRSGPAQSPETPAEPPSQATPEP